MPDRDDDAQLPGGADEAALAIVARHALHDEELVAALAAGALDGDDDADDRTRARGLVERCPACRAVHDDIAAITGSLHTAAAFTTTAPRDFRLTVGDARRLGGTVASRGVMARLARALLGVARPIGASVAALGLVGVLVGSAVLGSAGVAQRTAADNGVISGTTGGAAGQTAVPAAAPTGFEAALAPSDAPKVSEPNAAGELAEPGVQNAVAPGAAAWLLGLSIAALVLGALLFLAGPRATKRAPGTRSR